MGIALIIPGADYSENNVGKIDMPKPMDTDAIAYLTAIGEPTTGSIASSVNEFVIGLKDADIWDKIDSAYPFIGGVPAKVNVNLKRPTQLASLTSDYIVDGGVSGSGQPRGLLNDHITTTATGHILAYNATIEGNGIKVLLTSKSNANLTGLSLCRNLNSKVQGAAMVKSAPSYGLKNEIGTLMINFDGTNQAAYSNGVLILSGAILQGNLNVVEELYIGSTGGGSTNYASDCIISYVSVGEGLTSAQCVTYSELITELVGKVHKQNHHETE
jgi:hypothetical protein